MKKVEAFIKEHRLDNVTLALHRVEGVTGATISHVHGFGRGRLSENEPPQVEDFKRCVKLVLYCADDHVEAIVAAIQDKAHTGLRSDGKIFILPVEDAIRISTGERGAGAV